MTRKDIAKLLYANNKAVLTEHADTLSASDAMVALKAAVGLVLSDVAKENGLTDRQVYEAFADDLLKSL